MSLTCRDRRPLFLALTLLLTFIAAEGRSVAATVNGRLVTEKGPISRGTVLAYREADLSGRPAAVSESSAEDGTYRLDLEPGRYYLAASAGDLWAYCGQNPVVVGADSLWIGFELVEWPDPVYRDLEGGGLEGRILARILQGGQPQRDVALSLYLDAADGFRGMGYLNSVPSGADGVVILDMVPDGHYFLVARRRDSGQGVGPVMKGDLFAYPRHNPVRVEAGREVDLVLNMVEKRREREVHGRGLSGSEPGFSGRLVDRNGRPVPGIHVFAYLEPEMGHHKPAAISSLSDGEGRYRIYLPDAGTYFVGARGGFGDSPSPGEFYGQWLGSPDHSLVLVPGQFLPGIDITVGRVLEP